MPIIYTGVDTSRFTVVNMEKDMQVMISVIALLTLHFPYSQL